MNKMKINVRNCSAKFLVVISCLVFTACVYEVPITSSPTRKVNEKVLGNWVSENGEHKMKIRRLDDSVYIVSYDGFLFRAYHSDVAGTPLVSVQDIDTAERRYAYVAWHLSEDGRRLGWRSVSTKLVPREINSSDAAQNLLKENIQNPGLFESGVEFTREQ